MAPFTTKVGHLKLLWPQMLQKFANGGIACLDIVFGPKYYKSWPTEYLTKQD